MSPNPKAADTGGAAFPRIQYEQRKTLFVAYSHDLPGLLVCGHSREEVDERLPRAIKEIQDAIKEPQP